MKTITSAQNGQIKLLRSLKDKKGRSANGLFVAEGGNLVKDMQDKSGALFVRASDTDRHGHILSLWKGEINLVADGVFDSVTDTVQSQGILALVSFPVPSPLSQRIVLVMDGISDPGNAGTIIRTACAMGITDIAAADSADCYNPKAVRASMGGIFQANLITGSRLEILDLLKGYTVAVLDMGGKDVYHYKPPPNLALVVGNEAHGISAEFRERADAVLAVPMACERIESLNAAVSASIALSVITHNANA